MTRAYGAAIAALLSALEALGPATRDVLQEHTGLSADLAGSLLTRLCRLQASTGRRRAHIIDWTLQGRQWWAVFALGHGDNAPRPHGRTAMGRKYEREAVYQRQRRQQRAGADLQAAWGIRR